MTHEKVPDQAIWFCSLVAAPKGTERAGSVASKPTVLTCHRKVNNRGEKSYVFQRLQFSRAETLFACRYRNVLRS